MEVHIHRTPPTEGASKEGSSIKEGGAAARRKKKSASSSNNRKVFSMINYITLSPRVVVDMTPLTMLHIILLNAV